MVCNFIETALHMKQTSYEKVSKGERISSQGEELKEGKPMQVTVAEPQSQVRPIFCCRRRKDVDGGGGGSANKLSE